MPDRLLIELTRVKIKIFSLIIWGIEIHESVGTVIQRYELPEIFIFYPHVFQPAGGVFDDLLYACYSDLLTAPGITAIAITKFNHFIGDNSIPQVWILCPSLCLI